MGVTPLVDLQKLVELKLILVRRDGILVIRDVEAEEGIYEFLQNRALDITVLSPLFFSGWYLAELKEGAGTLEMTFFKHEPVE